MSNLSVKPGLNNNQLKIIATVSMLLDHVGLQFFPRITILRIIGRLAFPIFAYMIAEGCRYTRKKAAYFGKIAGLGIICQAAYLIAENSWYLGILITFSLSVLTIFGIDFYLRKRDFGSFCAAFAAVTLTLFLTVAAPILFQSHGFTVDYGLPGVLLPIAVRYAPAKNSKVAATAAFLLLMGLTSGGILWWSLLTVPLLYLYNEHRGKTNLKYLFYVFYPVHLAAIYLVDLLI